MLTRFFLRGLIGSREFKRCRYSVTIEEELAALVEAYEGQGEVPREAAGIDLQYDVLAVLLEDAETGKRPDTGFLVRHLPLEDAVPLAEFLLAAVLEDSETGAPTGLVA